MTLLYPYPYQTFAILASAMILIIVGLPVYFLYKKIYKNLAEQRKKIFKQCLVIAGIVLGLYLVTGIILSFIKMSQMNEACGFRYGTPETKEGELFIITKVQSGMPMDIAGLQEGDQILLNSVDDLYEMLAKNQGNKVEIPVKRSNEKLVIRLQVPEMEICSVKLWPFNKY